MKKALTLLLAAFMVLGASVAKADVRSDSLNSDINLVDDIDQIWTYPNMVTQYKNVFDVRTNYLDSYNTGNNAEWGGLLDGLHTDLGVIGAYVFRPVGYTGNREFNYNSNGGWYGVGSGWWSSNWNIHQNVWTNGTGRVLGAATPENKLDLFWGTSSDKGNFGIQLNYADAQPSAASGLAVNFNQTITDSNPAAVNSKVTAADDSRVFGANVGLGMQDVGPFNNADFHAGFYLGSISVSESNTATGATAVDNDKLKDNGVYTATLGALFKHTMDENSDMRLFGNLYLDQNNQTFEATNDTTNNGLHNAAGDVDDTFISKYGDIIANVGLGCNHKVLDGKATISSGVVGSWVNADFKESATTQDGNTAVVTNVDLPIDERNYDNWSLNWNANVEARVASWLTLRSGINRPVIWRQTEATTNNTTYVGGSPTTTQKTVTTTDQYVGGNFSTLSFGFGVNFENWELDGVANINDLESAIANVSPGNGLFFSNGNGNNNGVAGTIVSTYNADIRYRF